ncbi:hypothetical protein EDC94DRAFT_645294 [Helicostylum pulchrum]|nr:hypothetical protein EDC94DRAFT_645294 [Helicostylum pulchrum]
MPLIYLRRCVHNTKKTFGAIPGKPRRCNRLEMLQWTSCILMTTHPLPTSLEDIRYIEHQSITWLQRAPISDISAPPTVVPGIKKMLLLKLTLTPLSKSAQNRDNPYFDTRYGNTRLNEIIDIQVISNLEYILLSVKVDGNSLICHHTYWLVLVRFKKKFLYQITPRPMFEKKPSLGKFDLLQEILAPGICLLADEPKGLMVPPPAASLFCPFDPLPPLFTLISRAKAFAVEAKASYQKLQEGLSPNYLQFVLNMAFGFIAAIYIQHVS